jgi:uncharacterized membrane protein YdjX (TVP38/TMEM64 family)
MTEIDTDGAPSRLPIGRLVTLGAVVGGMTLLGIASGATGLAAEDLRLWLQAYDRLAPVVYVGLFLGLNTLGLPLPVLAAAGGVAFGGVEGSLVTLAAMVVTACAQFLLVRRLGGERLRTRLHARLGRLGPLLSRHGALAVAAGRLIPGPFSELNMAAGLTKLRFRDFAIGTALGCAPKAAAWSILGAFVSS